MLSMAEAMSSHGIRGDTVVLARSVVAPTARMSALLELRGTPAALTRLERLRRAEGSPVAHFVNHVRLDLVPVLDDAELAEHSLYTLIEKAVGRRISAGRRTFEARAAEPDLAERLEVPVGSPLQYFEQVTYLDDGRAVELSDVWVRSDRVRLTSLVSRAPEPG
jgi:GntR family transcriptional regulator